MLSVDAIVCLTSIDHPQIEGKFTTTLENLDWEKRGGAILRTTQKKNLARFHIFLKLPMLVKPISFLRKFVSFQKCF